MLMRRASHTIWSSIIQLGKYRAIIPNAYAEAVARASASDTITKGYEGGPYSIEEAFEIVAEWLHSIRESDPIFYASIKGILPSDLAASA
jgi:hypothetical protein